MTPYDELRNLKRAVLNWETFNYLNVAKSMSPYAFPHIASLPEITQKRYYTLAYIFFRLVHLLHGTLLPCAQIPIIRLSTLLPMLAAERDHARRVAFYEEGVACLRKAVESLYIPY